MYQKLHIKILHFRKAHSSTQPRRWITRCLFFILLGFYYLQPLPLFAEGQLVSQKIYYKMPEASEVFVVWGINGWQSVPKEIQTPGTVIKNKIMYTLMNCKGDTFYAEVKVPSGATLDYGFLITKKRGGTAIQSVWEGDYEHHIAPGEDGKIEVKSAQTLAQAKELSSTFDIVLYVIIATGIILGIVLIIKRNPGLRNQGPSITLQDSVKDCVFLGIVVLLSLILYVGKLGFYSDDWPFLGQLNMAADQSFTNLFQIFYDSPVVMSRPVGVLNYTLLYSLFGLEPLGYHLVNACVFLSGVVLFYLTLREIGQHRLIALAVPLVYALLPHYSSIRFWSAASGINLSMSLYYLSFYADLKTLQVPLKRLWGWKLISIMSLLGSTLAYEVALPFFFFNIFLVWYLGKQHFGAICKSSGRTIRAILLGSNLLVLMSVIVFKAQTARLVSQLGFLERSASIMKRAIDPNYSYGFNFKQAFMLNYGDFGLGLPRIIWKILNDYPDIVIFALGAALGLLIFGYLYYILRKSETPLTNSRDDMSRLIAWGFIFFVLGYAIFLTNSRLILTMTGVGNRINMAAIVGVALSLVGVLGWVSTILPLPRLRKHSFCVLLTLLCMSGFLINNTIATFWIKAYDKEKKILSDIYHQIPTLPKGSTLLLDGVCPYLGPAIVFESPWGLAWILMMHYDDSTLRADIVAPNMKVREDGIYTSLYFENRYPYENLFVYHYGEKMTYQLTDIESAHRYFQKFNPDYSNDCPQGHIGRGVSIF